MTPKEYKTLYFQYKVFRQIEIYATMPCEGKRTPEMVAENIMELLKKKPIIKKFLKI